MTQYKKQITHNARHIRLFERAVCIMLLAARPPRGGTRAFTLIETFVAVTLLATAIAGALSLASQAFNSLDVGGDQITASFLAQDGLEYVRFARDSARLSNVLWLTYLSPCSSAAGNRRCFLDSSRQLDISNPQQCPPVGGCPVMKFNQNSGFYNYNPQINNANITGSNPDSKFTRTITIVNPSNGQNDEARVAVGISWVSRGGQVRSIVLIETMYDWQ